MVWLLTGVSALLPPVKARESIWRGFSLRLALVAAATKNRANKAVRNIISTMHNHQDRFADFRKITLKKRRLLERSFNDQLDAVSHINKLFYRLDIEVFLLAQAY